MHTLSAIASASLFWILTPHLLLGDELAAKDGHPRPSYSRYSDAEMKVLIAAVRKSRPQMHRGGWQWDRLLSRYVDGGRKKHNELKILHAYFQSILDRYEDAKNEGKGDAFTLFSGHRSWGSGGRMRIYAELVRQKMLTPNEQRAFKQIVSQSLKLDFLDYSKIERGVNNRPIGINSGPAIAVKMFPEMPNAQRHKPWLDALWRELTEYGDTTETNYYPYGPLYLHGLLDMAEGMDKFETERDFLYHHARRYLHYVHGGGVRGNPNSSANIIHNREKIYADPWNAEYYAGAEEVNDGHVWYRLAKHYKDPEFLWASEQVLLGGRPPKGNNVPREYLDAFKKRYSWFIDRGIHPKTPSGKSKIGFYSPLKHKVPERLYLCPGRESGKPFASFYIYDRNNNYMHYCDGADGRLYEYCVDGAKFLHTSGKYTSGRAGVGETAYDMLSVLPPDMDFPLNKQGKMSAESGDTWKMASLAFERALNCRTAPDSKNWFFDDEIQLFRRRDDPTLGYAHGNMDGYWYLNNGYELSSVHLGSYEAQVSIQNLRLSGPKGEKILSAFDSIPKNLKLVLTKGDESRELTGDQRARAITVVNGGRRSGKSLRINVPSGCSISVSVENLNQKFDAHDEFTRISYDFKGRGGGLRLNQRTTPIYHHPTYNRGAILVRESLRAENRNDDSFGRFEFRNYYSARSRWTRQTVLTREGILIVNDRYLPDIDLDGYQASPCWMLMAEGKIKSSDKNWFDAPARDHAWWQTKKKRVLLLMHPSKGLKIGRIAHRSSGDIGGGVHNCFATATLKSGQPQSWLSVLVPFDEGEDPDKIAKTIKTSIAQNGDTTAIVRNLSVEISVGGRWSIKRSGGN